MSVTCSIAPMLSVRNGARAVEFYKAAFDAREVYRVEDPGGAVVSRLSVGAADFWLADESPEHANFSPESLGGGSVRMILTVPDPDAVVARAIRAGAQEVTPVGEAYGWRLGRVVDPFGHHWEIGHPLESARGLTSRLTARSRAVPRVGLSPIRHDERALGNPRPHGRGYAPCAAPPIANSCPFQTRLAARVSNQANRHET